LEDQFEGYENIVRLYKAQGRSFECAEYPDWDEVRHAVFGLSGHVDRDLELTDAENRALAQSPLHLAARGVGDGLADLLSARAEPQDINARDVYGWTPLHWAVSQNSYNLSNIEFLDIIP
jgi:hypothetical protein